MRPKRFFRSSIEVYEQVRAALDAAWGLPANGQQTCFMPATLGIRDELHRMMLAVDAEFCEYDAVAGILPQLLSAGAVEEIDEATYRSTAVE